MIKIKRKGILDKIQDELSWSKIVCLLGPRQCGKTTIAEEIGKYYSEVHYFDLENYEDLEKWNSLGKRLSELSGLIIMDEVQVKLDIFQILKDLYDGNYDQKILILSSAGDSIRQSSEILSGRVNFIEITPFSLNEVDSFEQFWLKGGFPKSYLFDGLQRENWIKNYLRTYIDLVIPEFKSQVIDLKNFCWMLSHYHGCISNLSVIANFLNVKKTIVRKYLSHLESIFMVRVLNPWYSYPKKRLTKDPKIYYRDSGLLNHILGIQVYQDIYDSAKAASLFEGLAIEEVIKAHSADYNNCYFFTSDSGAELDLLILIDGKKLGFEFKLSNAPKLTLSMKIALEELELDSITVICPNVKQRYWLHDRKVLIISLKDYIDEVKK